MSINQNETEAATANSDRSIQLIDFSKGQPLEILRFNKENEHK